MNTKPVYLDKVLVKDYKCFQGENIFNFTSNDGNWSQWTVILGNNNTGKTNLLKLIVDLCPTYSQDDDEDDTIFYFSNYQHLVASMLDDSKLAIGLLPGQSDMGYDILNEQKIYSSTARDCSEFSIYAYGVIREIEKKGISNVEESLTNSSNLFKGSRLINFEDWLFQLDYAANNKNATSSNRAKAQNRRDILIKLLTSEIFPEINAIQFVSDQKLNNYIQFKTEDGWHKISELGYGYQATLSWMIDFCKKLFEKYEESPNPLEEPAVLLVDEIDLHLHPQWQRSIIKYLSDIFKRTQFIVTSHSPFIIQSMENVNLYTLKREDGYTKVKHWGVHSFVGWRIEEILSDIMGLNEDVSTDIYQKLMSQFDKGLDSDDYEMAKSAYNKLIDILHPQSEERKLLDIQLSQILSEE